MRLFLPYALNVYDLYLGVCTPHQGSFWKVHQLLAVTLLFPLWFSLHSMLLELPPQVPVLLSLRVSLLRCVHFMGLPLKAPLHVSVSPHELIIPPSSLGIDANTLGLGPSLYVLTLNPTI